MTNEKSTFYLKFIVVTHRVLQEGFGEADFVNVGWGKKETQFHGTEGKEAARARAIERGTLSSADDGRVRVVWRGDGQMLAVSYVTTSGGDEPVRDVLPRTCRVSENNVSLFPALELVPYPHECHV